MDISSPALTIGERFSSILAALAAAVAARAGLDRKLAPMVVVLWPYLQRLAARLNAMVARRGRNRPPRPTAEHSPRVGPPRWPRLPTGFGWLIRTAPGTAVFGSQLHSVLTDPEFLAILKARPQIGRLLRPLCRMLGVGPDPDLSPALFPPRKTRVARSVIPQHSPEPLLIPDARSGALAAGG